MKKQTKKKLERELVVAMESVLEKREPAALAKTKKSILQAAKFVVKKFNKAIKAVSAKKSSPKPGKKVTSKVTRKRDAIPPAVQAKGASSNSTPQAVAVPVLHESANAAHHGD